MKKPRISTDALNPIELADLALDGEASLDDVLGLQGPAGVSRSVEHVREVRRAERLLRIEQNVSRSPDLTSAVLAEVGARRGWLDRRGRGLVWGGRAMAAAALLGALAVTLGVRRAAPEAVGTGTQTAALASVVRAGERAAADATAPLATVVQTIDEGKPVLAHLTGTLSLRASGAKVALVQVECSEAPGAFVARRPMVAEAPLDPVSQRTLNAVAGFAGSPRWVRVVTRTPVLDEQH